MVAGNRPSSLGLPPGQPLDHRHGGRLSSTTGELSIHGMGDDYTVEGNGTIKSLPTMPVGISAVLRILSAPTFSNSTKLICPNGVDYVGTAGDIVIARSDGDGVWRLFVLPSSGVAIADRAVSLSATQRGRVAANLQFVSPPQGRLTLTSGVSVPSSNQAGATTVYYTPAVGPQTPIYDGTNFIPYSIAEISQATTDTTKSPAAVAASSLYDIFVWDDAGTVRATRGPAWTNATTRSAGTALNLVNGIYLNNASITNGPAANRGTYVGTIASNGSSTIDFIFGGASAGGTAAVFNVWNLYNQVLFSTQVLDTTASWAYHLGARSLNGSNANRITFVSGLPIHSILAKYNGSAQSPAVAGALYNMSFGFDSTGGAYRPGLAGSGSAAATLIGFSSVGYIPPQTGSHFIQAIESGDGTNNFTVTGGASFQGGLEAGIWA